MGGYSRGSAAMGAITDACSLRPAGAACFVLTAKLPASLIEAARNEVFFEMAAVWSLIEAATSGLAARVPGAAGLATSEFLLLAELVLGATPTPRREDSWATTFGRSGIELLILLTMFEICSKEGLAAAAVAVAN